MAVPGILSTIYSQAGPTARPERVACVASSAARYMYVRRMRFLLPPEAEQVLPASRRIEQPRGQKRPERYECVETDGGIVDVQEWFKVRPHFANTDGTSIDRDSPYIPKRSASPSQILPVHLSGIIPFNPPPGKTPHDCPPPALYTMETSLFISSLHFSTQQLDVDNLSKAPSPRLP